MVECESSAGGCGCVRLCLVAWLHGGDEPVDAQALDVCLCLLLGACHHHRNAGFMGFLQTGSSSRGT